MNMIWHDDISGGFDIKLFFEIVEPFINEVEGITQFK